MGSEEASLNRISPPLDLPDHRAVAEIRLILALATMVAVSIVPHRTALPVLLFGVIAAYIVHALVLYWVVLNRPMLVRQQLVYWLDAGWLLVIIGLMGNSGSPLYFLLLFPVLVAAAQAGFVQGLGVAVVTTLAYVLLTGWLEGWGDSKPELLLRAGALLTLGFMLSRWAGAESHLKHKLKALNQLGKSPSLHDDDGPFWRDTLKELADYSGAESAFFLGREDSGDLRIYAYEAGQQVWDMTLGKEQAAVLAGVPERWAISWHALFGTRLGTARVIDMLEGKSLGGTEPQLQGLAQILDTKCWLSFPLRVGARYRGRVFLLGIDRFRCKPEWDFIRQLAGQISLRLDNLQLARQLTLVATTGERERISRDLHDGTVQPYLGLKYGLEALRRKVPDDNTLAADIDELVSMTDNSILQLRGYIRELRSTEADGNCQALTVIRAQVQQFETYSGLKVDVRGQDFILSESRLLEVRQIIAEGLSNIRRHTDARQAALDITIEHGMLRMGFINPVASLARVFTPRSLAERAAAMGGGVEVMRLAKETIVKVIVPIWTQEGA